MTVALTRRLPRTLALPAGVAVVAAAVFLLVRRALIDDAYITMTYARNVGLHLHWGLIADETANSATSPLNVLALGAITAVTRDAQTAVGVLFVVSIVLAAVWLRGLAADIDVSGLLPVVAVGLLLVNPLLLSTVGLEPYLTAALFAGLLRYGMARRSTAFGVVAGLTVLARPDMAVVVIVVAVVAAPAWWRAIRAALAVLLPWYVFSWFVLGSALPDTLVIKAGAQWSESGFWNGPLLYLGTFPTAARLAFLPVVAGLFVLVGVVRMRTPWQKAAAAAGLGALAHYGVYCFLRTAPFHWYYAPLIVGMTLCASIAAMRLRMALVLPIALACASLAFDLAHGLPWQRAPISTNWATAAQYQAMGQDLRGIVGSAAVESPGEIGTLAYYCECAIVDQFSDRGRVIAEIEAREQEGGLTAALLRLDYANLAPVPPRPVAFRLRYEAHRRASGPDEWPVDNWADGPGRMVLSR